MAEKVFVDTDIVLDLLSRRDPFYAAAARLFNLAAERRIELFISPVMVSNLFYILRKQLGGAEALNAIRKLRILVRVVVMDEEVVDLALASEFRDIEDALQYYCALQGRIGILLTRNTRDFVRKDIAVMNCEEYLELRKQAGKR